MIIHGKRVLLETSEEKLAFPKLSYRTFKLMEAKSRKIPYIKEIETSYLSNNANELFHFLKAFIEKKFMELLQKYPEFITSDPFNVKIIYCVDEARWNALYMDSSRIDLISIKINLYWMLDCIIYDIDEVEESILHEFGHYMDREQSYKTLSLVRKVNELADRRNNTTTNEYLISGFFIGLRNEGIAEFISSFKKYRKINFDSKHLKILVRCLQHLCNQFYKESVDVTTSVIIRNKMIYHVGAMMVCIIALRDLFQSNRKFSAWIRKKGFIWIGRREHNADKIGEFFGKRDFELYFVQDNEVDKITNATIKKLTSLSHLKFLKEYEKACYYFGIKEPFFTIKYYDYYKRECWKNYQKFKQS